MYEIEFDFDGGVHEDGQFIADPPHVYIVDQEDSGSTVEVLEDPTPTVEFPDTLEEHWKPGPFAEKLLRMMNEHM